MPALHFDGPMIAGGAAYGLDEIRASYQPQRISTGVAVLDEFTGGIEPGAVWALAGPSGSGVTSLSNTIAVGAAADADVIVCNGHVPTRALVTDLAGRAARDRSPSREAQLRVASWYPLIHEPPDEQIYFDRTGLLVVDTWDETWHAGRWPTSPTELIRPLRWFRHVMRVHNIAALVTARTPSGPSQDAQGWTRDAFDDVADVRIDLQPGRESVEVDVRCRGGGGGGGRGILRTVPGGPTAIVRE